MKTLQTFSRRHNWFGFWWSSLCSIHLTYRPECPMCKAGNWVTPEFMIKWFGDN